LALVGNPLVDLRGARVQLLGPGGLLVGDGGSLDGVSAQSRRFGTHIASDIRKAGQIAEQAGKLLFK